MKKAFTNLFEGPVGGKFETPALLFIAGSLLITIPPVSSLFVSAHIDISAFGYDLRLNTGLALQLFVGGLVSVAAYRLGYSLLRKDRMKYALPSTIQVDSSDPPSEPYARSGLSFGYSTDTGDDIYINDEDLCRHSLIVGQTGMGKTVFLKYLMFQQIQRGGGLLFVDGKLDEDNIRDVYEFAAYCGRSQDFLVINPGQPHLSNTYNPILFGDPDEIAARILSLIPTTTNSPGADHYKSSANLALVCFISALQEQTKDEVEIRKAENVRKGLPIDHEDLGRIRGKAYNFLDLALLTMNEGVLAELMKHIRQADPNSASRKNLSIFLDQYAKESGLDLDTGDVQVDLKRLKETLGGVGARMHQFGSGNFGPVLNSYTPEVKMFEAIRDNKIVYVALPTMGKDVAAQNLGKIVIADLRTAISWLQLRKQDRPKIPFLALLDEMNSYATESLAVMFEQARSARVALMPAIQTDSGLSNVSVDFKERILSNTENKIFFKLSSQDTAEMASDLIDETYRVTISTSSGETSGMSAQALHVGPNKGESDSTSNSVGEREMAEPLINPQDLKSLQAGECVLLRAPKVWVMRVPLIGISDEVRASIGPLRINRSRASLSSDKTFDALSNVDKHLDAAHQRRVRQSQKRTDKQKPNSKPQADQATPAQTDIDDAGPD